MTADRLRRILREVAEGKLSADAAFRKVRSLPFEDLGMANVDHHRSIRQGVPEVILGEGALPAPGRLADVERLQRIGLGTDSAEADEVGRVGIEPESNQQSISSGARRIELCARHVGQSNMTAST